MNKNIKKLAVMALAGLTLCGTAMAAPRGGRHMPPPPPMHHRAPAPRPMPPPPPPPPVVHHHHVGPIALGAAVVGGIVGGIISACR